MLLGSPTGSSRLRAWATWTSKGYPVRAEVPEYRVVHAGIHIDAVTSTALVESQPIGPRWLPDSEEFLKLGLPMSADLAAYMNPQIGNPFQQIQAP